MLRGGMPHAVLVSGPGGVGKTTFAEDVAAALLCVNEDPAVRPCRTCRACRALEHGNHPDVHRLAPTGAGWVIPIGGRDERGVRDLVRDLALLPVEGGARVAIIAAADRMTEDAQTALLKTLEEPPGGTVLLLTATDEERLLPTIRSRCVRIRLGPVARHDVEAILQDAGLAEAPMAARLARLAAGRPGDAVALARAPESLTIRSEVGRTLLDLASASRTDRLRIARDLLARTAALGAALQVAAASANGGASDVGRGKGRGARGRGRAGAASASGGASAGAAAGGGGGAGVGSMTTATTAGGAEAAAGEAEPASGPTARVPAAERRAAALALLTIWRDVARDLALVALGRPGDVRQLDLLDDLEAVAPRVGARFPVEQLRRLELAGERLEGNVSPELVVDALALGWTA
jgi:DNA polymerase III delta' subunit